MSIEEGTGERGKFIFKNGKLQRYRKPRKVVSVEIIGDEIEGGIESMATHKRQRFTSKRAYRKHLAIHGFRETGGDHLHTPRMTDIQREQEREERDRREDVEKAYYDVKYNRVEFTEQQKENHLREERACRMNNLPTKVKAPY